MHILLIHQYFLQKDGIGGSRFNEMARVWTEEGHKVTVISGNIYHNSGKIYPEYRGKYIFKEQYAENIIAYRCHVSENYHKNFLMRFWAYLSFVVSGTIAGLFKARDKYDAIVVTSPPLFVGISAYILSLFKRIPIVFEVRDLWPESVIDTGVLKSGAIIKAAYWFEAFIYKKSTLINVLTPAFRDTLIQKKNVPTDKVVFIPNAADFTLSSELLETFDANSFRKEHNLEQKMVISYVGAHGLANNLIQAVQTAKLLKPIHPEVLFLLIGDGMEKPYLKEEVIKAGLEDMVRFVDSVPKREVFKYILASDFGASILKKVDTFKTVYSNKTFDYMSCKKPIFMLIDGVSRDLVETANCGEYVEPEAPEVFASSIKEQIKLGKSHWENLGLNGYNYAQNHFDRDALAKKYLQYIHQII
jgi:glycosyltransferase involved in cell wall biosynthesis